MAGLKWNTGKLYYSTVELGYQHKLKSESLIICMYYNTLILNYGWVNGVVCRTILYSNSV